MPDLPTPQDAAEAALFSEYWDAVLSYADLCTSGAQTANQLATEAYALGMRETRAAGASPARAAGRRTPRLPMIPLLLTAVRTTAAGWEADGLGHKLDPDLRLWLNSDKAGRYTGPPLLRPVALRGLRDMQEADAALLWLAEVEALPLPAVARRLGLDPAAAAQELDQVRGLFRDRCHRAHLDTPMDAQCRSYARLLDAVTRSPAADTPGDLSRHLATCVQCAEAAACLRLHGGGLPAALAGGVIGWGGLAYLERRRRAAEVRLGAGHPEKPAALEGGDPAEGTGRNRVLRNSLLAAAVLLSVLALGVSMMPFGGSSQVDAAARDDRQPVADPNPSLPAADPLPSDSAPAKPSPTGTASASHHKNPDPEPQGSSASDSHGPKSAPATATSEAAPTCRVDYRLDSEWPDGFQATVTVTTTRALTDWRVAWSFRDGQQVGQMWDATVSQNGSRVTATAADYNKAVAAHGTLAFGFVGSWSGKNRPPYAFSLNGDSCATS
ncbi:cellulose binding domain-containing protein [Streptomyces olivochromogenes]|uniref:cellulose binding domain-containing protein n=1 Tax=Streptomyces olivochromogenes TaxID=1963 RepID=UPI001F249D9D|nr:cellulose binding domain-containing protein [Streptomyces olivochromogenes]MCF3136957.1 cellulose binding domain-containing protein [Streptomyces olivochromogenes]